MALPLYRKVGARTIQVQDVDVTGLKASAETFSTINKRLDQLQNFVYKKGAAQRKEEAVADALTRPVTAADVQEAMSKQGQAESFLSRLTGFDGRSIYEKTFNETQGTMLANEMSLNALEEINKMKTKAAAGQLDYSTAKNNIVDMIDGYTAAISAFSPEAAQTARTSMLTSSQTVLNAIGKQEAAAYKAAEDAKLEDAMLSVKRIVEDTYARGDYADPAFGFVDSEQAAQLALQELNDRATITGNQRMIPKHFEMFRQARINGVSKGVMSPEFASTKIEAYSRIKKNDLGVHQNAWDKMTDEERNKVKANFFKQISDEKKLKEDASKVEKDKLYMEAYELQDEAITATPERRQAIRKRLWEVNGELGSKFTPDKMLDKIRTGDFDANESDEKLMFELEGQVYNNTLTIEQVKGLAEAEEISYKQANTLQKLMETVRDRRAREAIAYGNSLVGSDPAFQNAKSAAPVKSNIIKAARDARDKDEDPKQAAVAAYEAAKVERFSTSFTAAQDRVTTYLARLGIFDESDLEEKAAAILNGTISIESLRKASDNEAAIRLIEKQFKTIERLRQ